MRLECYTEHSIAIFMRKKPGRNDMIYTLANDMFVSQKKCTRKNRRT